MIRVSAFVKEQLEEIKRREQHTSLDSVIRKLLERQKLQINFIPGRDVR